MDDSRIARMKELVSILNRAGKAYYVENQEIMSNLEYDRLYDELLSLEKETGTVLSSSPTQHVGYEAVDRLPKERHEKPMLSLDKTKDREALRAFIGERKTLVSWKLDGLTVVLTYEGGSLAKAVTRGNGIIGEVITPNARVFENIPLKIPYKGELILRGKRSYPIRISRRSTNHSARTASTKIREIFAAGLSGSWTAGSQQNDMSGFTHLRSSKQMGWIFITHGLSSFVFCSSRDLRWLSML